MEMGCTYRCFNFKPAATGVLGEGVLGEGMPLKTLFMPPPPSKSKVPIAPHNGGCRLCISLQTKCYPPANRDKLGTGSCTYRFPPGYSQACPDRTT